MRKNNLNRLFKPKHIAFIGGKDAEVAICEANRIGYEGKIWPVNPRRSQIYGHPCFVNVRDLPEAPDAVFLAIPARAAVDTIKALAEMGAGGAVCYSAGFKEAGELGLSLEKELADVAKDMAVVGPNCYGVINYLNKTALWPFAHGGRSIGYGAAIITQSGMLSSDITMTQRSVPITHMVSCGNQSILHVEDFIEYFLEQPEVKVIGVHIEGLIDVRRFAEVAIIAATRGIPVVALKTGSSVIGSSLTVSHTGSLSGSDNLYDALFSRCGVIRAYSPVSFLETLKFLSIAGPPKGSRVAGFTCSGGGATMMADYGEKIGLNFPAFKETHMERLKSILPLIATVSNPLDYTTPIWGNAEKTEPVFSAAINGIKADVAILIQDYPAIGLDESKHYYLADANAFIKTVKRAGIPGAVCCIFSENMDEHTKSHLISNKLAPMQGLNEALDALKASIHWYSRHAKILLDKPLPLEPIRPLGKPIVLNEAKSKTLLKNCGLPIQRFIISPESTLIEAAGDLNYPLALKMMGPKLLHKTEAGAVALGIMDPDRLISACRVMKESVLSFSAASLTDTFLLEEMAENPIAELLIDIRYDEQFGSVLTLASGGVLVELIGDSITILMPATKTEIIEALAKLRVFKLFEGFRGQKPVNLNILVDFIANIVRVFETIDPKIIEIELNPVFVYTDSVLVIDALITQSSK
jgi:acetate---CoA ligase (ADP-forming)